MAKRGPKPIPLEQRLWEKIEAGGNNECWDWTGSKDPAGYGRLFVGGRGGRPVSAHRLAWESANRRMMPLHLHACHSCDNPSCCNPGHVFPGSRFDNMRDAASKGRMHGQRNTHCSRGHELTPDNIYTPKGTHQRQCRTCKRDSTNSASRKRRARLKEMGLSARGRPLA